LSLKLACRLVALRTTKIADLQENDTAVHVLDLSPFVPPATKAIIMQAKRISGTGGFLVSPMGVDTAKLYTDNISQGISCLVTIENQELIWENTAANDDWDIYLFGYFVQPRTR